MTSEKQMAANIRNARKSCGPKTVNGKRRSRRNALRHGLTAQTVIGVLENPEDYRSFETAIYAEFAPQTIIERELVFRLASVLWRLRRTISIETGLLQIQGEIQRERKTMFEMARPSSEAMNKLIYRVFGAEKERAAEKRGKSDFNSSVENAKSDLDELSQNNPSPEKDIARCFLRLSNCNNGLFDRLGRYEAGLWRQLLQILRTLQATGHPISFRPQVRAD